MNSETPEQFAARATEARRRKARGLAALKPAVSGPADCISPEASARINAWLQGLRDGSVNIPGK